MKPDAFTAAEFALKAVAPRPACLFVGEFVARNRQNVLIQTIKDLDNAGIGAQLVLAGIGTGEYERYLNDLARLLGVQDRIRLVHDADPFTLTRLYLYCQYFLIAPGVRDAGNVLGDAVEHGCIPIIGSDSGAAFFDEVERVIRSTFASPTAFAAAHRERARATTE